MSEQKKLNASQRLETLETNMQEVSMYLNNMARDLSLIKEAIKLLGNKTSALQSAAGITDDQISVGMIANNVIELKEKVDGFVANGTMTATDVVEENCFIVGKEENEDGTVANPRVQFMVSALQPELRAKILGAKTGEKIQFSEGTLLVALDEIYSVSVPKAAQEAVEAQA